MVGSSRRALEESSDFRRSRLASHGRAACGCALLVDHTVRNAHAAVRFPQVSFVVSRHCLSGQTHDGVHRPRWFRPRNGQLDTSVLVGLAVVGLKFRHSSTRREAIAMLRGANRRESIWGRCIHFSGRDFHLRKSEYTAREANSQLPLLYLEILTPKSFR